MKNTATTEVLILVYHHFESDKTRGLSGSYASETDAFSKTIQKIERKYSFVALRDLLDACIGKKTLPPRVALLTFDDGTIDHYEVVFPLLQKKGLSGVFFVTTGTIEDRLLMSTHARHLLSNHLRKEVFYQEFFGRLSAEGIQKKDFPSFSAEEVAAAYPSGGEEAVWKYLINFALPVKVRDKILQAMVREKLGDPKKIGDALYLTWDQLRKMQDAGQAIGGHAAFHESLSRYATADLKTNVTACYQSLERELGEQLFSFAYPYGKECHFSEKVMDVVRAAGFVTGFTNIPGRNAALPKPKSRDLFLWRRVEAKDLPLWSEVS